MIANRIVEPGVALRALLLALIASFAIDAWAQVGYVHALSGSAASQRGSQQPVSAKVGDTFEVGTVFSTSGEGRLTLKFADGQIAVLGPGSIARVAQYRFDQRNIKASSLAIGLQDGSLRFVGGAIAMENREAVRISAGESMVSILRAGGIDFTVVVNTNGQEAGVAAVTLGEIAVRTPYGPILRIEADQAVPWRPGTTPPRPIPIAAMPAFIQAEFAGLRSMVLPGNAPVVIDVAKRTAVASARQPQPVSEPKVGPADAGYVHALSGLAFAQGRSGRVVPVSVGDTFDAGTTFNTAEDGRVVLRFADGQVVVLGASSRARVEQYRFDERNIRASSTSVALRDGAMRFVGGVIEAENRDGVRVTAGGSIVEILSTGPLDFTLVVDARGEEVGVAAVTTGAIAIRTPYGRISRIGANEAAQWLPGRAPAPPVSLAGVPTAVAGEVAALQATPTLGLGAIIAALPVTAAGPEPAAVAAAPAPAPADLWVLPFAPITSTTGGGRGCVGSPC